MSTDTLIILAIGLVPCVFAILFRVNAVLLFVSVVGGHMLANTFAADAALLVSTFVQSGDSEVIARTILQFLPVFMMLLLARRTASKSTAIMHLVPTIFVCALLMTFALDIVPASVANDFTGSQTGQQFSQAQNMIIGAAVVSQLLLIWSTHRPEHRKRRRHNKHGG